VTEYKTVHLPEELLAQITPELLRTNGYGSRPEFIKEAIREKLTKLKDCFEQKEGS